MKEEEEEVRSSSVRTGRSGSRGGEARFLMETDSSRRRGRSVSRHQDLPPGEGKGGTVNMQQQQRRRQRSVSVAKYRSRDVEDANLYNSVPKQHERLGKEVKDQCGNDRSSRQRRSVSVVRYNSANLENHLENFGGVSKFRSSDSEHFQQHSSNRQATSAHGLRRSMSQNDMSQSVDNYSSHSSSVTDDEVRDGRSNRSGLEKTIRAIYTKEKAEHPTGEDDGPGLYESMRNEVRNAVQEIRTELEKVMVKTEPSSLMKDDVSQTKSSNSINVIAEIRRNYTNKLEESEKRKQELLAELVAEEQRGQELNSIVRELLPEQTQISDQKRPSRPRRRSRDRTRMSRRLTEEAERYFEDFLSNVDDTDISSFDGERSDASSTLGGSTKLRDYAMLNALTETNDPTSGTLTILAKPAKLPTETDGVLLPWLQWETSNDVSPSLSKRKEGMPETSPQGANFTHGSSSFGSWNPEDNGSSPVASSGAIGSEFGEVGSYLKSTSRSRAGAGTKGPSFDMDEYLERERSDDLFFESWRQRGRIESGSLILCGPILF